MRNIARRRREAALSIAWVAAAATALPGAARANAGFGLNDGMTDWTANAYAGEAAKAYDAGTAWTNPAGMVRLQGIEADTSVNFIDPDLNFRGTATLNGRTITGPQSDHGIDPAISVGSGLVISLTPRLKFGFSAQSPFASRLAFSPENYVGRYQDTNNIPTDVQGLFSLAYAITPHFSIGGGPIVSYFKDHQSHALDLYDAKLATNNTAFAGVVRGLSSQPGLLGPSNIDPIAQFRGDDLALGYDIGALYQFNDNLRVGVNYHSAVYHELEGYQTIFIPPQIASYQNPFGLPRSIVAPTVLTTLRNQIFDANVKVPLPGWVDTSFFWQITPEWAVLGNVTWTNWSIFQNNRVNPEVPNTPITTNIQYNFRDTVTTGIGVNYTPHWNHKLMLQGGVTYDQSPVDDSNRQGSAPDGDRIEVGIGATYHLSKMTTLNIAYAHYFFPDENNVNNSIGPQAVPSSLTLTPGLPPIPLIVTAPAGTLNGHYDIQNDVLSVGIKSSF